MRKIVVLLAVVALAAPAMADLSRTVTAAPAPVSGQIDNVTRGVAVYDHTATNGYFQAFDPTIPDIWKGELCQTTMIGPWTMDEFGFGTYEATGAAYDVTISFFNDDGYMPYAGNFVGSFTFAGLTGGVVATVPLAPAEMLTFAGPDVWFVYECTGTAGPLHVNPGGVGTDFYADGWIDAHDDGMGGVAYSWYWYGGYPTYPNADLYAYMSTPEPGALILLSLCGLFLRRR